MPRRFALEILAALDEIARTGPPRSPGWERVYDDVVNTLRRCLDEPEDVTAEEVEALIYQIEAGGRWRLERRGEDALAIPRARRLELLRKILEVLEERKIALVADKLPDAASGPDGASGGGRSDRVELSPTVLDMAQAGELERLREELAKTKAPDQKRRLRVRIGRLEAAARLRARRNTLGLSQKALELRTGIDEKHISAYEHARRSPDLDHRLRLAEALEIRPELLDPLYREEEP